MYLIVSGNHCFHTRNPALISLHSGDCNKMLQSIQYRKFIIKYRHFKLTSYFGWCQSKAEQLVAVLDRRLNHKQFLRCCKVVIAASISKIHLTKQVGQTTSIGGARNAVRLYEYELSMTSAHSTGRGRGQGPVLSIITDVPIFHMDGF